MKTTFALAVALGATTLLLAACGGGDDAAAGKPQIVPKGAATTVDGLTYRVVEVSTAKKYGIPDGGLTYRAQNGTYLTIELALENKSGNAARAVGETITLLGEDGKRYEQDEDGSNAYHLILGPHKHDPMLYEPSRPDPVFGFYDVAPRTRRAGSVTFDVPRKALRGARLEIRAFDGGTTLLGLGL